MAQNVQTAGAPAGAVRIGDDGSVAAILPAAKAMTWEMLADDAAKTSQVKERFWVTFQPGEVRTCANCHGINTADQTGAGPPANPPAALAALLAQWRAAHPPGILQQVAATATAAKSAAFALIDVTRTAGSTGPASVSYATADGSALAGVAITEGGAQAGAPSFSGNGVIVDLGAVADRQYVTVALTQVVAADGGTGGSAIVRIGFLAGDVNGSRSVTLADLLAVDGALAQPVTAANFRLDVTANGAVTQADRLSVNANLTQSLPAP